MKRLFQILLSIPRTIYVNFVCFPIHIALRFPVIVSYQVSVRKIRRGGIIIKENPHFGYMKIGFGSGSFDMARKSGSFLNISEQGTIVLNGEIGISNGSVINVSSGSLIFGKNFRSNANIKISCEKGISFGDNVLIGWNCTFIDGDGHSIFNQQGEKTNASEEIVIGNDIWFCAEIIVFKGTIIADNSVVSYGSHVFKKLYDKNSLIGGSPAKILNTNISWED